MQKKASDSGFTLLEIMMVVLIVTILVSIVITSMMFFIARSRDRGRKSDLARIKAALEMYRSVNKSYPSSLYSALCPTPSGLTDSNGTEYLKKLPCDPSTKSDYSYTPSPAGCTTACTSYSLYACLENATDTQKDDPIKTSPLDCSAAPFGASYTIIEQ